MRKIALVDYMGDSLENGKLVGHPVNAGNLYIDILKEKYQLYCVAPANEVQELHTCNSIALRHSAIRNKSSRMQIVRNYFNEIRNLHDVWKRCDSQDILFFFNVDYVLYLFLMFHSKRTVICHTYTCVLESELIISKLIKKFLLYFSRNKISLQMFSNYNFKTYAMYNLFVPDFLYCKEAFDKYKNIMKSEKIVCVGTMSESAKELKELVKVFSKIDYPLEIVGQFFDKSLYKELTRIKSSNITIKDQFITNDEYFALIASAKYSILPYRVSCYKHKTSGIILESFFLRTIPIAPSIILQNSRLDGIGYTDINELSALDLYHFDTNSILRTWESVVSDTYDLRKNAQRILKGIDKIENNKNE